jgi:hypothetical protein
METLTSWKSLGHYRPVTGRLYFYLNFLEVKKAGA